MTTRTGSSKVLGSGFTLPVFFDSVPVGPKSIHFFKNARLCEQNYVVWDSGRRQRQDDGFLPAVRRTSRMPARD
ncbi:hypothetical protein BVRB_025380 [Beta vulgaris subsp. vulgaris]|uniref:Uncharacterized protein n=1 Tax=Beta vulgaris subsp. vulgaris TaxID=3555 RepID=A0A0J8B2H1_BETVV|nr:hypothetical protein BVRB_025380 [Beta vulgaris subsp. vulgaris]